jgi:hypothetical protein
MKIPDYVPPTWPEGDVPKQIHLELAVTDLDATVAEAVRWGARLAPVQPAPERWRFLLDPAGTPSVSPRRFLQRLSSALTLATGEHPPGRGGGGRGTTSLPAVEWELPSVGLECASGAVVGERPGR